MVLQTCVFRQTTWTIFISLGKNTKTKVTKKNNKKTKMKAIEESQYAIIVFLEKKKYADSTSYLDELEYYMHLPKSCLHT